MKDPDSYSVYDYQTGDLLPGTPSPMLLRDSLATDTGAVLGTYDPDESVWMVCDPQDQDLMTQQGWKVRTVYVEEDSE